MNTRISKSVAFLAIVVMLLASGCARGVRVGKLQTESQSVELGGAESVRVEINMGAGELDVAGGADKLLEADFTYNVAELEPEVKYSGGTLIVQHPDVKTRVTSLWDLDDYRCEWDLSLNDDVPMDLSIALGAGKIDLQLAGLSLTGLDVNVGAAEATIDLTGDWVRDLDVTVKAGVGRATLRLPRRVGVRVTVETGIGDVDAPGLKRDGDVYTNDAYGESAVTLRIDIKAGIGKINLELGE